MSRMMLFLFLCVSVCTAEEIDWKRLVAAVAQVESGGNPKAYNRKSGALGILQCREIVIRDINAIYGLQFRHDDMYDPGKAAYVFRLYGSHYGAGTAEQYVRIWNGGPKGPTKSSTLGYWTRVKNLYDSGI